MTREQEKRRAELSIKLLKMGKALMSEGTDNDDAVISSVGSYMILISGLIFDEEDISFFTQLCGMVSAKNLFDSMGSDNPISKMGGVNPDDIIKNIEQIIRDNDKRKD